MRKVLLLTGTLSVLVFFLIYTFSSGDAIESEETGMHLAMEHEFEITRDLATGNIPRERLLLAEEFRNAKLASSKINTAVDGIEWTERGPDNVGGRTRAVIFDLNDAANGYKKVWAGGVGGGLWYTNDITAVTPVWNKVNDLMDNLAISAIVQNPSNPQEIFAGTGEGWFNSDAIRGLGIWKSSDGGATWDRLLSTSNFFYVNDLAIDQQGNLYAAVRPYASGDPSGIQKSMDGGLTWTQVAGGSGFSNNRGADIEISASGDIYIALGTNGSTGGLYMSSSATHGMDTGNEGTWVNITPNASGVISAPGAWQRIKIASAPSNPNILYALFQGVGTNSCTSIQKFDKATNTWDIKIVPTIVDQGNNSNFTRGQAWYDLALGVDPNNPEMVYIGGVDALRTDNGGNGWVQMTTWSLANASGFTSSQNVHADHHVVAYAPGSSSRMILGTDGGVFYTETANSVVPVKPVFANKNRGYNVTQYYACAMHPTLPNYFLAGAQDNGTQKFTAAGLNTTVNATGGDGGYCYIKQTDPSVQITSYVYNNYYLSLNGGASFVSRFFGNTGSFINPTDFDDDGDNLYGGAAAGKYLRWNGVSGGGSDFTYVTCPEFGATNVVRHVRVSPSVPNRVYFGMSNGSVVRIDNAHLGASAAGTVIRTGSGSVSCIAIDPGNEDHMLVTYSNYGASSVHESFNANSAAPTWSAVEGNLPDMPVRWAMFDPRNSDWALLATELGVWSTDNLDGSTTDWSPTNGGLANVRVDMLQYRSSDRTIAAATHGRGLFTAVVPPSTGPAINFTTTNSVIPEETELVSGCRRYKDYTITAAPSAAPAGNATVSYTGVSATAKPGIDYVITTNGDFSMPSTTQTFPAGSLDAQNITIRIFDDAEHEPLENFQIELNVTGSTDAQAGTVRTHTITITDNDPLPGPATVAASALGTTVTEYLPQNAGALFYSPSGEIIARVQSTNHNYGCTQVTVDRAGNGASSFWNYNTSDFLMNKTFKFSPTLNALSSYQVTLYFTPAEKAGWEAATGRSWNEIMLIRLPSKIANVTPLDPQPDGPNTVEVVTPVRASFDNLYTLSYTFQGELTAFGAGIPGRMHTRLDLTATALGKDIRLDWTTSSESGSTVFEVEKSYDGINYRKAGTVNASGVTFTPTSYSFTDRENVQINYFRIRMKHSDGYVVLSNIVFLNKGDAPQQLYVLTNPFRSHVQVRFGRMIDGKALVSLYDAAGKLVHRSEHKGPSLTSVSVGTNMVISRGIYMLEVVADGKRYTARLKKE